MTRKIRILFVLSTLLVLLAAAAYFLTNRKDSGGTDETQANVARTPEQRNLTDFSPESLRNLSVENEYGIITLNSMDGENWLPEGVSEYFLPNEINMRSMAGSLARIPGILIDENPDNPDVYGLDNPQSMVRLVTSDGKVALIEFGDTVPSGNGRYARIPGHDPVYLVDSIYANKAFWKLNDLRETRLPEVDTTALTSVKIVRQGRTLFRSEPHSTDLDPFLPLRASMDIVEPWAYRQLIDDQRFVQFLENNPPPSLIAGFPETHLSDSEGGFGLLSDSIHLAGGDGRRLDLEIGKDDGNGHRYARQTGSRGVIFLVDEDDLGLLNIDPFTLTSPFVFLAGIDRVKEIRITGGKKPIILAIRKLGDLGDDSDDNFTINGRNITEKNFKKAYQIVIGLLREGTVRQAVKSEIPVYQMEFVHVEPDVPPVVVDYLVYDDTYLTAGIRGRTPEFIIGRYQLTQLMESLESLINTL